MLVVKPYFGKFQPDLYLLVEHQKDSPIKINVENMNKQDILKDFKTINNELAFADLIISGTVRFSIRGLFYSEENPITGVVKNWFEVQPSGKHLLTCVWWKDTQKGIDDFNKSGIYFRRTESSSKNSGYDYIVTKI